eukprot:TRINITY_DN2775_c0_g1_i2.p3 TRINITY_DN2775_c0_g1~~TRINITY_DN2775_c0_g1_i2.p3  ORF type:complete len:109 (-),score=28.48 TRINITY_DN2775_c0_g1_i2:137-463(-)
MASQKETLETYAALDGLLKNEATFNDVVSAVFSSIDKDKSGTLEIEEIEEFISTMCSEMGLKTGPGKENVREIFEELDEDKSKNISQEELGKFLRLLFEEQRLSLIHI